MKHRDILSSAANTLEVIRLGYLIGSIGVYGSQLISFAVLGISALLVSVTMADLTQGERVTGGITHLHLVTWAWLKSLFGSNHKSFMNRDFFPNFAKLLKPLDPVTNQSEESKRNNIRIHICIVLFRILGPTLF